MSGNALLLSVDAAAGGGPFDPSQVAGLALWLRADVGVYKDAGTTPASDGDPVQQWNDQSGNSNTASQTTASSQPVYHTAVQNGKPAIQFNSVHSTDTLPIPTSGTLDITDHLAIFLAVKVPSTFTNVPFLISKGARGGFAAYGIYLPTSGKLGFECRNSGGNQDISAAGMTGLSTGTWYLIEVHWDGGSVTFYVNGALVDTETAAGGSLLAGGTGMYIESFGGTGQYGDWYMAEVLVYGQSGAMSGTDRANIENYLNTKYAIY
jgi:hypothetical protein